MIKLNDKQVGPCVVGGWCHWRSIIGYPRKTARDAEDEIPSYLPEAEENQG